jgi:hypothetical protein
VGSIPTVSTPVFMRFKSPEKLVEPRGIEPVAPLEIQVGPHGIPLSPDVIDDATALRFGSSTSSLVELSEEERDAMVGAVARGRRLARAGERCAAGVGSAAAPGLRPS